VLPGRVSGETASIFRKSYFEPENCRFYFPPQMTRLGKSLSVLSVGTIFNVLFLTSNAVSCWRLAA